MMGQQCRKESLFYYFRLEDQVPETQPAPADRPLHRFQLRAGPAEELL
jgi:hypothetical protein